MKRMSLFVLFLAIMFVFVPAIVLAEETDATNRAIEYGLEDDPKPSENRSLAPVSVGDRQIQGVAPGESNTDATNMAQFKNTTNENGNSSDSNKANNVASVPKLGNSNTRDATWAEGKIRLAFGWIEPDKHRNEMQSPSGQSLAWLYLPYYSSGAAALLDSEGNIVEEYTGESQHLFEGLKAGTYTIRITLLDKGYYHIVESIVNGGPIDHLITTYESTVEVKEGDTSEVLRWVVVEYKAYGFKTTTEIGTFKNGTKEKQYYEGRNWSFENTDPSSSTRNPTFNTHDGIYYNDSAGLYSGMSSLEEPILSAEELKKGYTFAGWKLAGDTSGKVYTTKEALSYKVKSNVEFIAVFDYPKHKVTFNTNTELGLINGKDKYSYTQEFSDGLLTNIPTPVAKEGFEFVGWFNDLSTNVIPDSELRNTVVDQDLNFYAKYRRVYKNYTVKYTEGSNGALEGTTTLNIREGNFIPTVPTVNPEEGYRFTYKWKVKSIDNNDLIKVGDTLTEIQLSRLQINYNMTVEALYEEDKGIEVICSVCGTGGDTPSVVTISNNNLNQKVNRSVKGTTSTVKTGDTNSFDYNYIILLISFVILSLLVLKKEKEA